MFVVEDEDNTRGLCHDEVSEAGLGSRTAYRTEQALEIPDQGPIDIVITDLLVPRMGGRELLRRIQQTHPQTSRELR